MSPIGEDERFGRVTVGGPRCRVGSRALLSFRDVRHASLSRGSRSSKYLARAAHSKRSERRGGEHESMTTVEARRLAADAREAHAWKRWGPYLAERQWGTVREDYSATGECWTYFPHDDARSRAYRW